MNRQEHILLLAERTTLQCLLEDTTPDDVLERSGLEARLEEVQEQLAAAGTLGREPARAKLTFRGRPVIGSYGIFAEFGANATNAFTDAVAKVAAALSGPLAAKGPVPNRQANQMLITSTAVGSFGFELVEHAPEQLDLGDESPVAQALDLARSLLESTLGTDDDLAELAGRTDPRAVDALRSFLDVLASNEAISRWSAAARRSASGALARFGRACSASAATICSRSRRNLPASSWGCCPSVAPSNSAWRKAVK